VADFHPSSLCSSTISFDLSESSNFGISVFETLSELGRFPVYSRLTGLVILTIYSFSSEIVFIPAMENIKNETAKGMAVMIRYVLHLCKKFDLASLTFVLLDEQLA